MIDVIILLYYNPESRPMYGGTTACDPTYGFLILNLNLFFFFRRPNISVHTAKLYFYHILSTGLIHVCMSDLHSNKILSPFQTFHLFKEIKNSEGQQFSSCISNCCRVSLIDILMSVTFNDSKPDKAMCRLAYTSKPWRWSSHDTSSWTV